MKTSDVKIGMSVRCKGEETTVVERIPGRPTKKRNMQNGMLYTGQHRMPKKFRLENGEVVYAKELIQL